MPAFNGGIGPRIPGADGKELIYACIEPTNKKDGIPYLDFNSMDMLDLVWHEFGHSFVNPLTDKYPDRIKSASGDKLFEPIKGFMAGMGYVYWEISVNEHIIRAINVRLFDLHLGSQQSQTLLEDELKRKFIYIEPLIEKLKDFETQRDKNSVTFSEFYPELLNVLDSLQEIEYWNRFNLDFVGPVFRALDIWKLAVVYPTHDSDTSALRIVREQALKISDFFASQVFWGEVISLADTAALKVDLSEYGIMSFGTIESNLFLKHYASSFPFKIENQLIYADKEYTDKEIKFITCVPNPLNSRKGMFICTALSNNAIQGISDIFYDYDFGFFWHDYILFLNRETVISRGFYKKEEKWSYWE